MKRTIPLLLVLVILVALFVGTLRDDGASQEEDLKAIPGRWNVARESELGSGLSKEQRDQIQALQAIGYLSGSQPAPSLSSVTVFDSNKASSGLNFYTSGHGPEAVLMNMDGEVLHSWSKAYHEVWPDMPDRIEENQEFWRRARLLPGGEVLAIIEGFGIIKLDMDSNVVWAAHNGAHHDLEVQDNGDILVLTRRASLIPAIDKESPVLEDFVVKLNADGEEIQRVSLLNALKRSEHYGWIWENAEKQVGDSFHTNSLEVITQGSMTLPPAFQPGRVLVSIRELDTIAVVDLDEEKVTWAMQGPFDAQHDATMLSEEGMMLFNNIFASDSSAVQIFDVVSGSELWKFTGTDEFPFFSKTCGTAQPLANGNILVTESNNGKAFEVDRDGIVVWEFYSPHRAGDDDQYVATLFEMLRLPAELDIDWVAGYD